MSDSMEEAVRLAQQQVDHAESSVPYRNLRERQLETILARAFLAAESRAAVLLTECRLWRDSAIGERTSYDLRLEAAIDALRDAGGGK